MSTSLEPTSLEQWLEDLASEAPAPGGGAAAALAAAAGAALVEMVCNLTVGKPAFAEHEERLIEVRTRAGARRAEALGLADEDAEAFSAVIAAYRLPRETEEDKSARSAQIQAALAHAADVPRRTAVAAGDVLDLAESIVDCSNPNVISDVAAAAASARAALATAVVNIEINITSITDPLLIEELRGAVSRIERDLARADAIVQAVRERISS